MMTAILTGIGAALSDPMELGIGTASRAGDLGPAVLFQHDPVQAGLIGRKLGLKVFEGVFHRLSPCLLTGDNVSGSLLAVKG
jgi:hypothetical protein